MDSPDSLCRLSRQFYNPFTIDCHGDRASFLIKRIIKRLADIVRPTCEVLGIELRTQRKLPQLDPARKGLLEFLARG